MPLSEVQTNEQGQETLFAPSLFSQVQDALKSGTLKPDVSETEITSDDIQGIIEMPFDIASFVTKIDEMGLSPEESKKLCKIWVKPMQKLLGKYPKADLILASSMLMGIIAEKVIIFYMATEKREKEKIRQQKEISSIKESKAEEVESGREAFGRI